MRLEGITFDAKVSWWIKQWFGTAKLFVPPSNFLTTSHSLPVIFAAPALAVASLTYIVQLCSLILL